MPSKLPKMAPCPFCGSRNLKRDAWGVGFHTTIQYYVGTVKCRDCCGSMKRSFSPLEDISAHEGYARARELATEAWNTRAEKGTP